MGHEFAEPHPAFAVLRELEHRWRDWKLALPRGHSRKPLALANRLWQIFATSIIQGRLGIEQIHLRRSAGLEQIDDPLGLGLVMNPTVGRSLRVPGTLLAAP